MRFTQKPEKSIYREEHLSNVTYYEAKQQGLGARYLLDFENNIKIVCSAPHRYPVEVKLNIQRKRLNKFPFTILYRQLNDNVEVLAIAHYRLRPGYWVERL